MKLTVGKALFGLATILILTTAADGYNLGCYHLHAVFTFNDVQYFIYGYDWMVGLDFDGKMVYWGYVSDTDFHYSVTAAVGARRDDMFYLMSAKYEQGFNDFYNSSIYKPLYWTGAEGELMVNPDYKGIDAAFERSNDTVYFAGCDYVVADTYHMEYIGKGNVDDLNLPCNVDAAWSSPNFKIGYITKGLNLWRWYLEEDKIEGPVHLFSVFCPLSAFLCPA